MIASVTIAPRTSLAICGGGLQGSPTLLTAARSLVNCRNCRRSQRAALPRDLTLRWIPRRRWQEPHPRTPSRTAGSEKTAATVTAWVVERVFPDPAGVSRDDLVFRSDTMHVVSMPGTLLSSSVNPHSCLLTGTQQFTWGVTGGTGQFDDATGSFTGTVSAVALLARNPDGSCSFMQFPRHEVDKFAESGTLSL
jgi:hypothetical protein